MHNGIDLVILDMDGTIVRYENSSFHSSWDAIGHAAGLKDKWDALTEQYYPNATERSIYEEWFRKNCELLQGIDIASIEAQIFPPPYTLGFLEFSRYLKERNIRAGIVSGGVNLVADRIQRESNLDFAISNILHITDGIFAGSGTIVNDLTQKGKVVREICQQYDVPKENVAYIGDHENDIPAWKEVGLPLGMNVKREACHAAIERNFKDFTEALGYFEGR